MTWHEGDVIRKLRAVFNWGLKELERRSGVDRNVINRIERGKTKEPKRETLRKIASAFLLTPQQLTDAVPVKSFRVEDPPRLGTSGDKPGHSTSNARAGFSRRQAN